MAHTYSHLYRLPTTGLRFFTVYGPWGRPDMALFLFTRRILAGEPIDVFNHGRHTRDFTYVDDIVEGVIRTLDRPIHKTGGLTILKGSLAPEGAVVKSAGFDDSVFTGTARVFDGERAALDALAEGTIKPKDVVVIRYEGPKGGPGMREMLAITGAIKGAGLGKDVLLVTDGRFSGGFEEST